MTLETSSVCWLVSLCCEDSVKSVALLCWGFLVTPCLPPELDRLDGLSDLRADLTLTLVKSSLLFLRDLVAEADRSVVLLLTTRLGDSPAFEAIFSPTTFRTGFVAGALLLSFVGCFLGDSLPALLVFVCGFVAARCGSMSTLPPGRLDAGRDSLSPLTVTCRVCGEV